MVRNPPQLKRRQRKKLRNLFGCLIFLSLLLSSLRSHGSSFDVFAPETSRSAPVVVYIHGGAWVSGSKSQYTDLAKALALREVCVVLAEYRLAPTHTHPAQIEDLTATIKGVEQLAKPGCDRKNVFLMGHSAGAHMIAFWATKNSSKNIRGLIGLEGIYDLPNLAKKWPDYKNRFLKAEFGEETTWPLFSPTRLPMKSKAPWLVIHSASDELVDEEQSKDFFQHLKNQKILAKYLLQPNETHFGIVDSLAKKDSVTTQKILNLIRNNSR